MYFTRKLLARAHSLYNAHLFCGRWENAHVSFLVILGSSHSICCHLDGNLAIDVFFKINLTFGMSIDAVHSSTDGCVDMTTVSFEWPFPHFVPCWPKTKLVRF
jgi:hypothetical protein